MQMEITKTGDDYYHVSANENFVRIEEDVDGPKLMGLTGLTTGEVFYLFDLKPIGYKATVTSR